MVPLRNSTFFAPASVLCRAASGTPGAPATSGSLELGDAMLLVLDAEAGEAELVEDDGVGDEDVARDVVHERGPRLRHRVDRGLQP